MTYVRTNTNTRLKSNIKSGWSHFFKVFFLDKLWDRLPEITEICAGAYESGRIF